MLSSWNGAFARKVPGESMNYGDLLTFIKKSLFVDNSRAFLYFSYIFGEMIP